MTGDSPRLLELRRRVQADPASIAFAQLAEECRRAGSNEEAVSICRNGLAHHPDYLSARVTLGRALVELGQFDEAQSQLALVVAAAPDNLAANRALAELHQARGDLAEALTYYRAALQLAKHDVELEHAVERIEHVVSPPPPPAASPQPAPVAIEDLFDFDTLLEQLGGRTQPKPEGIKVPGVPEVPRVPEVLKVPEVRVPTVLDAVELREDDRDPFSVLERQLRESEEQPRVYDAAPFEAVNDVDDDHVDERVDDHGDARVMAELEDWLAAIAFDRQHQPSA